MSIIRINFAIKRTVRNRVVFLGSYNGVISLEIATYQPKGFRRAGNCTCISER